MTKQYYSNFSLYLNPNQHRVLHSIVMAEARYYNSVLNALAPLTRSSPEFIERLHGYHADLLGANVRTGVYNLSEAFSDFTAFQKTFLGNLIKIDEKILLGNTKKMIFLDLLNHHQQMAAILAKPTLDGGFSRPLAALSVLDLKYQKVAHIDRSDFKINKNSEGKLTAIIPYIDLEVASGAFKTKEEWVGVTIRCQDYNKPNWVGSLVDHDRLGIIRMPQSNR